MRVQGGTDLWSDSSIESDIDIRQLNYYKITCQDTSVLHAWTSELLGTTVRVLKVGENMERIPPPTPVHR